MSLNLFKYFFNPEHTVLNIYFLVSYEGWRIVHWIFFQEIKYLTWIYSVAQIDLAAELLGRIIGIDHQIIFSFKLISHYFQAVSLHEIFSDLSLMQHAFMPKAFERQITIGFVLLLNIKQFFIAHVLHAWTTTRVNNQHAFKSAS